MRTKCNRLDLIRNLNLWGNDLHDISVLRYMPNLEVCSLSVNSVSTLADLGNLQKLSELYLRKNKIRDLAEVLHLVNLRQLRVLWLNDNPCALLPHYRQYVLHHLPCLVKLDSQDVAEDERRLARRADMSGIPTCIEGEPEADMDPVSPDISQIDPDMSMSADPFGVRGSAQLAGQRRSSASDAGANVAGQGPRDGFGGGGRRCSTDSSHYGGRVLEARDEDPMAMLYEGRKPSRVQDSRESPGMHASRDYAAEPPQSRQQQAPNYHDGGGRMSSQQLYEADLVDQMTPRSEAGYYGAGGGPEDRHSPYNAWQPAESPPRPRTNSGYGAGHPDDRGPVQGMQRYGSVDSGLGDGYQRARGGDPRDEQPLPRGSPHTGGFRDGLSGGGGLGMSRDVGPGGNGTGGFGGSVGTGGEPSARADNILCAVLALIKELDRQGLELVRRAIEQRQNEM